MSSHTAAANLIAVGGTEAYTLATQTALRSDVRSETSSNGSSRDGGVRFRSERHTVFPVKWGVSVGVDGVLVGVDGVSVGVGGGARIYLCPT